MKPVEVLLFSKPILEIRSPISGDRISRNIRIRRVHLEEDTGRLIHPKGTEYSLVDFNRAGIPLMELVTEPDINSAEEAKAFAEELRLILRYLGVSDADMEKGHLRVDVNISLRPQGDKKLYTKIELKNLNSFRSVERGLAYEISRLTELWQKGAPPNVYTTRGWDENKGISIEQRSAGSNPRSTVGTQTEIYDYLRLLFASIGSPHCPKCKKPMTIGVMNRVDKLADRQEGEGGEDRAPFKNLIPLNEIIADVFNVGVSSMAVKKEYEKLIGAGNEFKILLEENYDELVKVSSPAIAQGIINSREGKVELIPGYDGEYGKIKISKEHKNESVKQSRLF